MVYKRSLKRSLMLSQSWSPAMKTSVKTRSWVRWKKHTLRPLVVVVVFFVEAALFVALAFAGAFLAAGFLAAAFALVWEVAPVAD
jgi:hypothetical protein